MKLMTAQLWFTIYIIFIAANSGNLQGKYNFKVFEYNTIIHQTNFSMNSNTIQYTKKIQDSRDGIYIIPT